MLASCARNNLDSFKRDRHNGAEEWQEQATQAAKRYCNRGKGMTGSFAGVAREGRGEEGSAEQAARGMQQGGEAQAQAQRGCGRREACNVASSPSLAHSCTPRKP